MTSIYIQSVQGKVSKIILSLKKVLPNLGPFKLQEKTLIWAILQFTMIDLLDFPFMCFAIALPVRL